MYINEIYLHIYILPNNTIEGILKSACRHTLITVLIDENLVDVNIYCEHGHAHNINFIFPILTNSRYSVSVFGRT
jgi:hypothetical protein